MSVYIYEFEVWPHEQGWERSVYDLFRLFGRFELEFTEQQWAEFRAGIERSGLTLRTIQRRLATEIESVL